MGVGDAGVGLGEAVVPRAVPSLRPCGAQRRLVPAGEGPRGHSASLPCQRQASPALSGPPVRIQQERQWGAGVDSGRVSGERDASHTCWAEKRNRRVFNLIFLFLHYLKKKITTSKC